MYEQREVRMCAQCGARTEVLTLQDVRIPSTTFRNLVLASLASVVIGIYVLLGLPGAIILEASLWLFGLSGEMLRDNAWPAALIMTVLWPIGLILGYALSRPYAGSGRVAVTLGILTAWCLGLSLVLFLMAV